MANNIAGITTLTGQLMTNLIRGYSAYEVAVQQGFEGTVEEWLASLVGDSVEITVVEDTDSSYILRFTVGDESVTTPNLRQNLNEMKSQIQDMQTQVSHHSAEIINLHATDTSLDSRVTALEQGGGGTIPEGLVERVTALETSVGELETSVGTIGRQVEGWGEDISSLNSDVAQISSSISTINASVADLSSNVTDLSDDVERLKNGSTDTRSRLRSLESSVSDLFDHIDSLEASIAELNTKFNTYIDSTDVDLDQLSEIVNYIKSLNMIEFVDELPAPEDADPRKIYVLRPASEQEVEG